MDTLNIAIIGCGVMGRACADALLRWGHLDAPPLRPRITWACSPSAASRDWMAARIPGLRCTADHHEVLADPAVDAVYVAVPHHLHAALYADCLRSGKHLLGEKPFGIDAAANAAIAAVPLRSGQVVACVAQFAFFPGAQRIARLAAAGAFGRILEVDVAFRHASDLDPAKPANWKRLAASNGVAGVLNDLGMHVWHLPLRAGWIPERLFAVLDNPIAERPDGRGGRVACDTWANAQILARVDTAAGAFPLHARLQRIAPGETNSWSISVLGTALSARFSTAEPKSFWTLPYRSGEAQAWRCEQLGYEAAEATCTGKIFEFGFGDAMQQMLAAFCRQIAGAPVAFPCASVAETIAAHRITAAALRSHASGAVERV